MTETRKCNSYTAARNRGRKPRYRRSLASAAAAASVSLKRRWICQRSNVRRARVVDPVSHSTVTGTYTSRLPPSPISPW